MKGVLLEISPITLTLEHQSGIICFNRSELEYIGSKKTDLEPHTFHPYLSWISSLNPTKLLRASLYIKQIIFHRDTVYRLKMINEEKGELIAEAVVSNTSDIRFHDASLQLVEGTLNQIKIGIKEPNKYTDLL